MKMKHWFTELNSLCLNLYDSTNRVAELLEFNRCKMTRYRIINQFMMINLVEIIN